MKLIKLKYVLLIIIVILIFCSVIKETKSEQAPEPILYDFYNDVILDIDKEDNPNYYNIKQQSEYNGNYIGYKSFDDIIENEIDYNLSDIGATLEISDYLNHINTINSTALGSGNNFHYGISFENHSVFYFSYWFSISDYDYDDIVYFYLLNEGINIIDTRMVVYTYISNNRLILTYGSWQQYDIVQINNNTWYNVQYVINCTSDTIDFYLNYELLYSDLSFILSNDFDYCSSFVIKSQQSLSNSVSLYLDCIDHSYSYNWNFFRSSVSEVIETKNLEVDKYEFDYDNNDFKNDLYNWVVYGYQPLYNDVNINSINDIENYVNIYSKNGALYENGVNYLNIDSNSMILNITFDLLIPYKPAKSFLTLIYLYDNYNITDYFSYIYLNAGNELVYVKNIGTGVEFLFFEFSYNHHYSFNYYLNYYDNIMILTVIDLYDDSNYFYSCSINQINRYGLSQIRFENKCFEVEVFCEYNMYLYFVGIYENGKSFIKQKDINEFGLMSYKINGVWNSDNHNLLTIDSRNRYDLFVNAYYEYYLDGYKIREIENQTKSEIFNFADEKDNNYPKFSYNNPYLILRVYGLCNNFNQIEIEGILLIDNKGNSVFGNYYYNNTDSNINWFYCIDNKLYYNINSSDDYGVMRITFNVNDILLNNESIISYTSFITNNYSGNIKLVAYQITETFNVSEIDVYTSSYKNITEISYFTLTSIIIEIQSNNNSKNIPEGYIQNINIYLDKSLFPEFEPIDYLESTFLEKILETMIPLILYIVPALAVRTRFGYKVVLPIWILLTIVYLFTGFIPFWICFIIFLAITLMVLNKENEVLD